MWEAPESLYPDIPKGPADSEATERQIAAVRTLGLGGREWTYEQAGLLLSARTYADAVSRKHATSMNWKECRLRMILFILQHMESAEWLQDWAWRNRNADSPRLPKNTLTTMARAHLSELK